MCVFFCFVFFMLCKVSSKVTVFMKSKTLFSMENKKFINNFLSAVIGNTCIFLSL